MNAKSKNTLKAAAVAAGLVAVLLPTGCTAMNGGTGTSGAAGAQPAPGSTVVAATHTVD